MNQLAIEQTYITKTIENMQKEIEFLTKVKGEHEEEQKGLEVGSYLSGLLQGRIAAAETQIEFLERQIKFLQGALDS